jgi:F-type H+-transporting ATPase subunit c
VSKITRLTVLMIVAALICATPAFAQDKIVYVDFSKFFGLAITTVGAAYGIGKLASSALESMARQPEVAGNIQTAMIIAAALIEGFTFFALFICFNAA